MEANGKTLIRIASVLYIIGGVLGLISSIFMLTVGGSLMATYGASAGVTLPTTIIGIASAVVGLITGILGMKFAADAGAASKLMLWGLISLAIAVISLIMTIVSVGFSPLSFVGLILPLLYLIGVYQNKNS